MTWCYGPSPLYMCVYVIWISGSGESLLVNLFASPKIIQLCRTFKFMAFYSHLSLLKPWVWYENILWFCGVWESMDPWKMQNRNNFWQASKWYFLFDTDIGLMVFNYIFHCWQWPIFQCHMQPSQIFISQL